MSTHRSAPSSRMRFAWPWAIGLVGLIALDAVPAELARLLPASGLTFYVEYDGLDAHSDAWKASAAREILVEKTAGSTMLGVERQILDAIFKVAFSESKMTGADFMALQDHLVSLGFAFATYEDDGESSTVFVLNGFGGQGGLDRFERLLRGLLRMEPNARFPEPTRSRGRDLRGFGGWKLDGAEPPAPAPPLNPLQALNAKRPPTGLTWWLEGDALVVVKGPTSNPLEAAMQAIFINPNPSKKDFRKLHQARVSSVLDALEAKGPGVATHPAYLASMAEGRDIPGFEPSGLFFVDAKEGNLGEKLGSSKDGQINEFTLFEVMGLDRANRVVARWGFRGKSLLTDVRFEAPTPWKGLLGQLDVRGFPKGSIPPIPRGNGAFAVGPVVRGRALDELAPLRGALKPEYLDYPKLAERMVDEATTAKRRADLLERLGPTWSVYASPAGIGEKARSALPTWLIGFDDADKVDQALKALASEINADLAKRLGDRTDAKAAGVEKPTLALERLAAPDRGYRLVSSAGLLPWLSDDLQPTVLIGKAFLVVAANPTLAREAIVAESNLDRRDTPTGELARSIEALPKTLSFLSVGNPRDSSWPEAIVNLPSTAGPFVEKFLHVDLDVDPPAARAPDLLDALGVPKNVAVASPRVEEIRALIHPSVLAASVEERSFRVISLEALPLACLWFDSHFEPRGNMDIKLKFGPGK
jgi:hypothetical protein